MIRVNGVWWLAGLSAATLMVGCEGEDGRPEYPQFEGTVLSLAQNEPDLSTFVELADLAGLNSLLGETQASVTVFAPNNAAFNALPSGELTRFRTAATSTVVMQELNEFLRFHMLGGTVLTSVLQLGGEFRTVTSTIIHVDNRANPEAEPDLRIIDFEGDEAMILKPNLQAANGVLHVIDAVLTPPPAETGPPPPGSLGAELTAAGFTSLIAAADRAGLAMTLTEGEGPFTVFAPNNAAFTALGDITMVDDAVLENVLLNHVVMGSNDAEALALNPTLMSLAGHDLVVAGGGMTVNGVDLGDAGEIEASNGVAHELAGVLLPPTAREYLVEGMGLTRTNTAVTRADVDLAGALEPDVRMGEMPITFFAPDGMAWTDAAIDPMTAATATLAAVLRNHIVVGQVLAADLMDGEVLTTLNGTVAVAITGTMIELVDGAGNRAAITSGDVRTLTGAVHVVDGILGQ